MFVLSQGFLYPRLASDSLYNRGQSKLTHTFMYLHLMAAGVCHRARFMWCQGLELELSPWEVRTVVTGIQECSVFPYLLN